MTKYKLPSQQGAATAIGPTASALPLALLASALLALSAAPARRRQRLTMHRRRHRRTNAGTGACTSLVAPPAPPTPVAFETAIVNAATTLFKNASANVAGPRGGD
jgi:hypothetical protein